MPKETKSPAVNSEKKKRRSRRVTSILLVAMMVAGLCIALYPVVSDYWNKMHSSRAIADYTDQLIRIDNDQYDEMLAEAQAYNEDMIGWESQYVLPEEMEHRYRETLNVTGTGIMGYIELPKIGVNLPIYHGTSDGVLQIAVGHLEWSSLPVGGAGTHCVLSGHRGLPSAKLFTDLDKIVEGDEFILHVLDEELTYEVERILIVEPHEITALVREPGRDLCTLVTCTPYMVNSHRLLVTGHRVEGETSAKPGSYYRVQANATQIRPAIVAIAIAAPILLLLFIVALIIPRRRG